MVSSIVLSKSDAAIISAFSGIEEISHFSHLLAKKHIVGYGIMDSGKLVGYVIAEKKELLVPRTLLVREFMVGMENPHYRNTLFEFFRNKLHPDIFSRICLTVNEVDLALCLSLRDLGFRAVDLHKDHFTNGPIARDGIEFVFDVS